MKTTPERSRLMSRVRHSGTSAETAVINLVQEYSTTHEFQAQDLPGSPDIVDRGLKWAILVNGCFWHAHQDCNRWRLPKTNRKYWYWKFGDNRTRDRKKLRSLKE